MAEKCIRQLPPVRVPESLEHALMRLAAYEDRPLSEYVRGVLMKHVFGHAPMVELDDDGDKPRRA